MMAPVSDPLAEVAWPVRAERLTVRRAVPQDAAVTWEYRRLPEVTQSMTSRSR